MDIDKVRALTDAELGAELSTQRRHLYDLRFQLATRQLTDHSQLTSTRRTIARVLTVMTERGLDESVVPRATAPEPRKATGRGRTRTAATPARSTARTTVRTTRSTATKSKEAAAESASGGNEE